MSKQRQPRWKQLGYERSNSHNKSHHSRKSSKYTPKKSPACSEKEFSLNNLHNTSQQISDLGGTVKSRFTERVNAIDKSMFDSGKLDGSQVHKQREPAVKRIDSGSSLDFAASSIYPKGPDNINVSEKARKMTDKNRQNSGSADSSNSNHFKINPKASVQQNFKQCLKFLEKTERDLISQRTEFEKIMNDQQEQFNKVKYRLFETFIGKAESFQDKNLKKIIDKHLEGKSKSNPKALFRVTSEGNISNKIQVVNNGSGANHMTARMEAFIKDNPHSLVSRDSSSFKQNFNKMFGAISTMKKGLDECKQIRQRDSRF